MNYSMYVLFVGRFCSGLIKKTNLCGCVDISERVKLKRTDYPLVLRVMQGPCEQVCKVFLMEEDLGEEVTYDVNHHIYCNLHRDVTKH